jgi:outer membrane protein assembly factor BamB
MKPNTRAAVLLLSLAAAVSLAAADWPQWRGPSFNGSSPETRLPEKFSATENIAWAVPMPGAGAGTPVVLGDRVFVSTADARSQSLQALCLDRKTGKVLWQHKVADGTKRDDRSNYASPSPATDGKLVVFFYGNGDLLAFDLDGKELWRRNIQKDYGDFAFQWTFSASPTLHGGKLYLQVLQRDQPVHGKGAMNGESYLLCMEPSTGKTLWRQVRPTEAQAESREAFSTPVPYEHDGKWQLLITGGDMVSGHDPATGKELWRWGTWNPQRIGHWRLVPSPVAGGGVVLACAPKKEPVYAVKLGGSGVLKDSAIAWTSPDRSITSDVPTPAFADGDFFVLSDVAKTLTRITPGGKAKWTVETPGRIKYEASPLVADGRVYIVNFNGDVVVFSAADGAVLHQAALGTPEDRAVRASIIAAHGQLFIRTDTKLYCVGKSGGLAGR